MVYIDVSYPQYDEDTFIEYIDPVLNAIVASHNPSRGDVIHIMEASNYRNDGILMWDEGLVHLGYDMDIDDYGYVPPRFTVGDEFLANHWSGLVTHNMIVWVDTVKYRQQLLNNLSYKGTYYDTPLGRFHIHTYSHSPTVGMDALRRYINSHNVASFDENGTYDMIFKFDLYDEFRDIHNASEVSSHYTRANGTTFNIHSRDNNTYRYKEDGEGNIYML